jgi:hypothetical protein
MSNIAIYKSRISRLASSLVKVTVLILFVVFQVFLINGYLSAKIEAAQYKEQVVILQDKLENALVPESSLGEFASNRVIEPVKEFSKSATTTVKGWFGVAEKEPTVTEKATEFFQGFYDKLKTVVQNEAKNLSV